MTLTLDIIQQAHRESNLIQIGKQPTADQFAEALKRLNVIVSGVYGNEVGDELLDWPVGNEGVYFQTGWSQAQWAYPLINTRIIADSSEAQTLYLPPDQQDGSRIALIDPGSRLGGAPITLDGNGRTIEGQATVTINTPGANMTWFYRADLGNWALLSELTGAEDEEFPFPYEFDDYFITRTAMRINPRFGRSLGEASVVELEMTLRKLRARYRQPVDIPTDLGVLMLTGRQGVWRGSLGDTGQLGVGGFYNIVKGRMGWNQ